MKNNMTNMKSTFKIATLSCALIFALSSCKSQKAVIDANQTPEAMEEPMPEPMPEPEVKTEPETKSATPEMDYRLNNYFGQIGNASSTSTANNNIREALGMFSTGEAPVLVIFYTANGLEDFDEPTTITKYLNYLKDVKTNPHKVKEMVLDDQGRIRELVLIKK
ncbi:MAG: hypothetical protein ACJAXX_003179 [Roseivirga sp.]|jgi:hypothetical protein